MIPSYFSLYFSRVKTCENHIGTFKLLSSHHMDLLSILPGIMIPSYFSLYISVGLKHVENHKHIWAAKSHHERLTLFFCESLRAMGIDGDFCGAQQKYRDW